MSNLPSRILVNEDSNCESDSEIESKEKITKYKSRKKNNVASSSNHQIVIANHSTDDDNDEETESQQLNYEESPIHSTSLPSPISIYCQDKMRRRLQFFFMNPIEKFKAKRR